MDLLLSCTSNSKPPPVQANPEYHEQGKNLSRPQMLLSATLYCCSPKLFSVSSSPSRDKCAMCQACSECFMRIPHLTQQYPCNISTVMISILLMRKPRHRSFDFIPLSERAMGTQRLCSKSPHSTIMWKSLSGSLVTGCW
jgi:hypothetical protein